MSTSKVSAEEDQVPFSVTPVLPENQVNEEVTYFDIEMTQNQRQNLEIIIHNSSDEEIELEISTHFAATNSNGVITYDGSIDTYHESMNYAFDDISSVNTEQITVEADSEETVVVNVEAPDESFDGMILGGIFVTQEADNNNEESAVDIINQYAYALAVQITEEGNDTEVEPDLGLESVSAGLINHRTGLQTTFYNPTPTLIQELHIKAEVFENGSDEPLFTEENESFNVAPNNVFNFPVSFNNERLEPGDYTFRATAENESHQWEFEETFEITEEEAEDGNEGAVELVEPEATQDNTLMYILLAIGAVVTLLLIVVIVLLLRRKKS
ncbi:DUF916 and DUF3324 domain-containing protein [Corticicoccus populi]|uniref:DUF916 and DUF3324 domain-containing protein n=1 Tax=Corticicoccus populi TaxID=1812821 RepID=A0ABW5WT03_9STAP